MSKKHYYQTTLKWTGNAGSGTADYTAYHRDHEIKASEKIHVISGSSDPAFRGDRTRYNPEELLLASLSSCHMLWYLHLCSVNHITVISYEDKTEGTMTEAANGSGQFESVTLYPAITIVEKDKIELATSLHQEAHKFCFIANSVNFPVLCKPSIS